MKKPKKTKPRTIRAWGMYDDGFGLMCDVSQSKQVMEAACRARNSDRNVQQNFVTVRVKIDVIE